MNNQNHKRNIHDSRLNFKLPEPQKMSRKSSTYVDLEMAKIEADKLLSGENAENELKKNLLYEEKSITIFQLCSHLGRPIDYLCFWEL